MKNSIIERSIPTKGFDRTVGNSRRAMNKSNDEIKHMIKQMRKQFHSDKTTDLDPKTLLLVTLSLILNELQTVAYSILLK